MKSKAVFTFFLSLIIGANVALACSCVDLSPKEKLAHASVAFVGTVIAKTEKSGRKTYEFSPAEIFKGELKPSLLVNSFAPGSDCEVFFEEGGTYLIYASGPKDKLITSLCSGNRDMKRPEGPREVESLRAMQGKDSGKLPGR